METKFTKSTDETHIIELESSISVALWNSTIAFAGKQAGFEVHTNFVGDGSKIKITGESKKGKKLGQLESKIFGNKFRDKLPVPEDIKLDDLIFFKVELPQLGIKQESNHIPVIPIIKVTNMKWNVEEARRKDTLTLSADIEGLRNNTEILVNIYEFDDNGAHDKVTEIPAIVNNGKVELLWEYEYHESTLKIPTEREIQEYDKENHYKHPEYFFTFIIGDVEFGREQESGLLKFIDQLDFTLCDEDGHPYSNEDYIIVLADNKDREGTLDENGHGFERDLPPGEVTILLPKIGRIFGK
jgi:hypothetical protein